MATLEASQSRRWAQKFFTIWGGQSVSLLGSSLVQFALVWWLTSTTGSATVLATASLAAILPQVIVGPFAGALVDRWNRRLVMIVADALIALSTLALIVVYMSGGMEVWHIYVVMFWRSALGAFHWTAMQASTSLMVPHAQLSRVAGLNQMLQGAMGIIAPPLGALLMAVLPLHLILAIDIVTASVAVLPLLFIGIPQPDRSHELAQPDAAPPSMLADMRAGLRYVRHWPGLLMILVLAMILNFVISPAFSLMPILVTKHFGGGALQLGTLQSAWAIGIVVGGLVLGAWGGFKKRAMTSLLGIVGMGVGILGIAAAPSNLFALAVAGMLFGGFMNPMANGPLFAMLQTIVAPEMQGRVMSLMGSGSAAMMPLSLLVAGPIADLVGVRVWYVAAGITCVFMGLLALNIPAIMNAEHNGQHKPQAVPVPVQDVEAVVPTTLE
jgi:MFS transporter, DHA3 family, macrolide efflux protein